MWPPFIAIGNRNAHLVENILFLVGYIHPTPRIPVANRRFIEVENKKLEVVSAICFPWWLEGERSSRYITNFLRCFPSYKWDHSPFQTHCFFTPPAVIGKKNNWGMNTTCIPTTKISGEAHYCSQPTIDIPIDIQSVEYLLSFDVFFSEKKNLGVFHGWKSPTAITFFSKGKWSKTKPPWGHVPLLI